MNTEAQNNPSPQTGEQKEHFLSPNHTPRALRRRPDRKLMQILRATMLVFASMILLIGLLLIVLPMFRVQNVTVEGNGYYSADAILAAAKLQVGFDESMALNGETIMKNVFKGCPYVEHCTVTVLPFSVKIVVQEKEGVMQAAFANRYFTFDRSMKVLQITEEGEGPIDSFLCVKLPPISSIQLGKTIKFSSLQSAEWGYISSLYDTLKSENMLSDVTYMDLSNRFSISYHWKDHMQIKLGGMDQLSGKLSNVRQTIDAKTKAGIELESIYSVMDASVSDISLVTWNETSKLPS